MNSYWEYGKVFHHTYMYTMTRVAETFLAWSGNKYYCSLMKEGSWMVHLTYIRLKQGGGGGPTFKVAA